MKKNLLLIFLIAFISNGYSQVNKVAKPKVAGAKPTVQKKAPVKEKPYSNWLFIKSDKALQYRFQLVKQEGDIGYFRVQFKTNFEDPIFCKHHTCLGYMLVFGYPSLDNEKSITTSYKFYNTYKEIYTRPELVPIKLFFSDGSKRLLTENGFFYTLSDNDTLKPAIYLFDNCVDDILSNNPNYHRCKPYTGPEFKETEAIVLQ